VKIKKTKPTQLSTLNHSHAVVAPQRDSSTHHNLLHHSKVHPPHAAGWRTKLTISTTFWNTIYFYTHVYTASAAAGNLSYDCARGRHCTVSAAASRRHVDASLDLFTRKSPRVHPRIWRDLSEKRALSARRLILWMVGV
jgi:hypothetical protein